MNKRQTKLLKAFFGASGTGKKWESHLAKFQYSGYNLVYEINSQNPGNVLDFGCGDNNFKGLIENLTGLDIINENADIVCDIMEIELDESDGFDIILALGSINFGKDEKDIVDVLKKCHDLLNPNGKIYMRVNPGIRHTECKDLIMFQWDIANVDRIGKRAGFGRISPIQTEHGDRLFFVYKKK